MSCENIDVLTKRYLFVNFIVMALI